MSGIEPLVIASAAAAGSSLLSANASLQAGKAQQKAYNFNAQIGERNAAISDQQAELIAQDTMRQNIKFRDQFEAFNDATAQAFRYNGWVADSGTPLTILLNNALEADEEIASREYNSRVAQTQAQESALASRMQADLQKMYGQQARAASRYQAATTLLQGAQTAATLKAMT